MKDSGQESVGRTLSGTGSKTPTETIAQSERFRATMNRRYFLGGLGAAGAVGLLAACGSSGSPAATSGKKSGTKSLEPVTLTYGVPTLDTTTSWFAAIPIGLGYYKAEGLNVTVEPLNGGSESIGAIVSGRAQFATQSTEVIFTSVDGGTGLRGFYCEIPKDFIGIAVLASGNITSPTQLRGKTIGTLAIGGDPELEVEAVMSKLGMKSGVDYHFLAVGAGAPALHALETGRVQALGLWAMIYAGFQLTGGPKLRIFQPSPITTFNFEHATVAMNQTLTGRPDTVRAFSRAIAKSLVFLSAADPKEIAKLQYKIYPNTRPAGMSDSQAITYGAGILTSLLPYMDFANRVTAKSVPLGSADSGSIDAYRNLLYSSGVIKKQLPSSEYFTSSFITSADAFDYSSIIKDAKSFTA